MKKTGQLLHDKREAAGLTLSEVALATKINPKVLTAIESGDEGRLPAKTFLKGFVRSYALFLKLDVEEVMAVFHEETGGPIHSAANSTNLIPDPVNPSPSRRRSHEENTSGMRTAAVIVIVVLIGLIIGVRELIEKYQHEKVTPAASSEAAVVAPVAPEAAASNVNATPAPAAAAVTTPATPEPAPEKKVEAKVEPKPEPVKETPPPPPEKKAEAKPEEPKKEEKPEEKAAAAAEPAAAEPEKKSLAKAVKNEIILEALDKVDVTMKIKGEEKRISLGPTQVHTIRSTTPVIFDFSDGGAVNITVNGHERGPAGDLGKPKELTIP